MRTVVLANGGSGTAPGEAGLAQAFQGAGQEVEIHVLAGDAVEDMARRLAGPGTLLVAAGGDGTISAVAHAVADAGGELGVLPCGTRNHFARDLGVPLALPEAVQVALHGKTGAVDVAEAGGRLFVNNCSIGLYPEAVAQRDSIEQRGWTRAMAMLRASWRTLRRLPHHRVLLTVDGKPMLRTTSLVFIGNNAYETALPRAGRRQSLTDGKLCVYHLRRTSRLGLVLLAVQLLLGRQDAARDFVAHDARTVTVDNGRRTLHVAIDGEVHRLPNPVEFHIRPKALRVRQP